MTNLAIVVVAYNRDESLKRLLESLRKADYLNRDVTLIISIDYSKNAKVLEIAKGFCWNHGEKKIINHTVNLGLKKHVLEVGNLTKDFDAIIVLEDDLIVSNQFYNFAVQAYENYKDDQSIAGISLYSFRVNPNNRVTFYPSTDGYDNFFLQYAQSWGQVWWKTEWDSFISWMSKKDEFLSASDYPASLDFWSKNSWLKYHILFCIENNKFFVYPKESFTGNFSEPGVHNQKKDSTFQSPFSTQMWRKEYLFSGFDTGNKYDSFFERLLPDKKLAIDNEVISTSDIEMDLYGTKANFRKPFCVSSQNLEFAILSSFGLQLKPHEANIILNVEGNQLYLYDTTKQIGKRSKSELDYCYYFKLSDYKIVWISLKKLVLDLFKIKIKDISKKLRRG